MNIVVYISSHGFGHLAQIAPVLNRLHQLCKREKTSQAGADMHCLVRCSLPERELRARLSFPFILDSHRVDVGVVQKNAVEEDQQASIDQMRQWVRGMDADLERDIALLAAFEPDLILSDISPLAFPVAQALGVPGIALATLDWHTIYAHWLAEHDPCLHALAAAYAACDLLLTPPMAMHMPVFSKQQDIGLIAPYPKALATPIPASNRHKALLVFGGCGNPPYDLSRLADMSDWLFLIPDAPIDRPENVHSIHFDASAHPIDFMPHVDVVLCKPGYGVLSEAWRTNTPIAWVERPDFPEFPMLKGWLDRFPACGMRRTDFQCSHWQPVLHQAMHHSASFPEIGSNEDNDGANDAAKILLSFSKEA